VVSVVPTVVSGSVAVVSTVVSGVVALTVFDVGLPLVSVVSPVPESAPVSVSSPAGHPVVQANAKPRVEKERRIVRCMEAKTSAPEP
jgi:hypothetical protein